MPIIPLITRQKDLSTLDNNYDTISMAIQNINKDEYMGNKIISWIIGFLGAGTGKIIGSIFIAMLPVIELRGAIPVSYALGMDWKTAFICAMIGNILPVPFILLFVKSVFKFMKKHNILKGWVIKQENRALSKKDEVSKFQFWGLAIFVAIPLPGTGGWTGALIASVLKMDLKKAFLSISIGVIIAGIIVTFSTYGIVGALLK